MSDRPLTGTDVDPDVLVEELRLLADDIEEDRHLVTGVDAGVSFEEADKPVRSSITVEVMMGESGQSRPHEALLFDTDQ